MKLLSLFILLVTAITVNAAQLTWSAYNFGSSFDGGVAYLLEMPTGTTTVDAVKNYLETSGLTPPQESVIHSISSSSVKNDGGFTYVENIIVDATMQGNSYFVLVFDEANSRFVISEILDPEIGSLGEWNAAFNETMLEDYWVSGIVAGTDPSVPEPTVLALLALGVAGLALKRRVV